MNKEKYLKDKQVTAFILFLADVISGDFLIEHQYTDRKKKRIFKFTTLQDAFEKYHWNGEDYKENLAQLNVLISKIKKSDNESAFYQACLDILFWGDGDRKGNLYTHNKKWIDSVKGIKQNITEALGNLTAFTPDFSKFGSQFRMNAGFTKIYAFLSPDTFIIYDSRVAAALAYLIVLFCEKEGLTEIPELLQIRLAEAKGDSCRIVAVENTKLTFKKWNSNQKSHAVSNVHANWIIGEALILAKKSPQNMLMNVREVEAALFMLGYDFPQYLPTKILSDKAVIISKNKVKSKSKPKANDIREFVVELISVNLKKSEIFEFTSSMVRESIGGDLTAICGALKMESFFNERKIAIEVIDAPTSGLGRVTYQTSLMA